MGNDDICENCVKNYENSSKAMEADVALELVEFLHNEHSGDVFIEHIVADDDSTMRSLLQHKSENSKKGKLKKSVDVPKWLADPSHRTKVVAKPIYALAAAPKSKSLVTKLDAMRIKKYYSYFIKQCRDLPFEEMKRRSLAPVEHLFNNHEYCHESWCVHKKKEIEEKQKKETDMSNKDSLSNVQNNETLQNEEGNEDDALTNVKKMNDSTIQTGSCTVLQLILTRTNASTSKSNPKNGSSDQNNSSDETSDETERDKQRKSTGYYRDKKNPKDMEVYRDIMECYLPYVTDERLRECHHHYSTQLNESMNNYVTEVAPKNRTYCRSLSLQARVHIVIGVQNNGYMNYWKELVGKVFGIQMTDEFVEFLKKRQNEIDYHKKYHKELKVRQARIKNYFKKMNEEVSRQMKDKQRGATYEGRGGGLENAMKVESKVTHFTDAQHCSYAKIVPKETR